MSNVPGLKVGDKILFGKYLNREATIQGFGEDDNGQPTVKTDRGEIRVFHFRVQKLMEGRWSFTEHEMSRAQVILSMLNEDAGLPEKIMSLFGAAKHQLDKAKLHLQSHFTASGYSFPPVGGEDGSIVFSASVSNKISSPPSGWKLEKVGSRGDEIFSFSSNSWSLTCNKGGSSVNISVDVTKADLQAEGIQFSKLRDKVSNLAAKA